jgi:hypothetical protein
METRTSLNARLHFEKKNRNESASASLLYVPLALVSEINRIDETNPSPASIFADDNTVSTAIPSKPRGCFRFLATLEDESVSTRSHLTMLPLECSVLVT